MVNYQKKYLKYKKKYLEAKKMYGGYEISIDKLKHSLDYNNEEIKKLKKEITDALLSELNERGFYNYELNIAVLKHSNNNIDAAVALLSAAKNRFGNLEDSNNINAAMAWLAEQQPSAVPPLPSQITEPGDTTQVSRKIYLKNRIKVLNNIIESINTDNEALSNGIKAKEKAAAAEAEAAAAEAKAKAAAKAAAAEETVQAEAAAAEAEAAAAKAKAEAEAAKAKAAAAEAKAKAAEEEVRVGKNNIIITHKIKGRLRRNFNQKEIEESHPKQKEQIINMIMEYEGREEGWKGIKEQIINMIMEYEGREAGWKGIKELLEKLEINKIKNWRDLGVTPQAHQHPADDAQPEEAADDSTTALQRAKNWEKLLDVMADIKMRLDAIMINYKKNEETRNKWSKIKWEEKMKEFYAVPPKYRARALYEVPIEFIDEDDEEELKLEEGQEGQEDSQEGSQGQVQAQETNFPKIYGELGITDKDFKM